MSANPSTLAVRHLYVSTDPPKGKRALKLEFVHLRAEGLSLGKIASRLKLSKTTLSKWQSELETEIRSVRADALDELRESYKAGKKGRIEVLGTVLERLIDEAKTRDLTTVPIEKILDLTLKYQTELKTELGDDPVLFKSTQGDRSGPKMDTHDPEARLQDLLARCQAGGLNSEQVRQEMAIVELIVKLKSSEANADSSKDYSNRVIGGFLAGYFKEFLPKIRDSYVKTSSSGNLHEFLEQMKQSAKQIDTMKILDHAYANAESDSDPENRKSFSKFEL
jgi:transcriptional regulator with XRE-family HTH domain